MSAGHAHDSAGRRAIIRCSTGKTRFRNAQAARRRLHEILDNPKPDVLYTPCNIHGCRKCGGFHLTSKVGKPWKHGKRRR